MTRKISTKLRIPDFDPPLRSYLFAPGNNVLLLQKVFHVGADAVVLDLEDSVAASDKTSARRLVAVALNAREGQRAPRVFVRINSLDTPHWREDLAVSMHPGLFGIRLPKTESPDQVRHLGDELEKCELRSGLPVGKIKIACAIETAKGVLAAPDIARLPRLFSLTFGAADFVNDIGAEPGELELETLFARSQLVLASRVAGVKPPVASVFTNISDMDGLRRSTLASKRLGFFGRSCVHPSQVPVVNELFTPQPQEISAAREILLAFEKAKAAGQSVCVTPSGQFVDPPVLEKARGLLSLAEFIKSSRR